MSSCSKAASYIAALLCLICILSSASGSMIKYRPKPFVNCVEKQRGTCLLSFGYTCEDDGIGRPSIQPEMTYASLHGRVVKSPKSKVVCTSLGAKLDAVRVSIPCEHAHLVWWRLGGELSQLSDHWERTSPPVCSPSSCDRGECAPEPCEDESKCRPGLSKFTGERVVAADSGSCEGGDCMKGGRDLAKYGGFRLTVVDPRDCDGSECYRKGRSVSDRPYVDSARARSCEDSYCYKAGVVFVGKPGDTRRARPFDCEDRDCYKPGAVLRPRVRNPITLPDPRHCEARQCYKPGAGFSPTSGIRVIPPNPKHCDGSECYRRGAPLSVVVPARPRACEGSHCFKPGKSLHGDGGFVVVSASSSDCEGTSCYVFGKSFSRRIDVRAATRCEGGICAKHGVTTNVFNGDEIEPCRPGECNYYSTAKASVLVARSSLDVTMMDSENGLDTRYTFTLKLRAPVGFRIVPRFCNDEEEVLVGSCDAPVISGGSALYGSDHDGSAARPGWTMKTEVSEEDEEEHEDIHGGSVEGGSKIGGVGVHTSLLRTYTLSRTIRVSDLVSCKGANGTACFGHFEDFDPRAGALHRFSGILHVTGMSESLDGRGKEAARPFPGIMQARERLAHVGYDPREYDSFEAGFSVGFRVSASGSSVTNGVFVERAPVLGSRVISWKWGVDGLVRVVLETTTNSCLQLRDPHATVVGGMHGVSVWFNQHTSTCIHGEFGTKSDASSCVQMWSLTMRVGRDPTCIKGALSLSFSSERRLFGCPSGETARPVHFKKRLVIDISKREPRSESPISHLTANMDLFRDESLLVPLDGGVKDKDAFCSKVGLEVPRSTRSMFSLRVMRVELLVPSEPWSDGSEGQVMRSSSGDKDSTVHTVLLYDRYAGYSNHIHAFKLVHPIRLDPHEAAFCMIARRYPVGHGRYALRVQWDARFTGHGTSVRSFSGLVATSVWRPSLMGPEKNHLLAVQGHQFNEQNGHWEVEPEGNSTMSIEMLCSAPTVRGDCATIAFEQVHEAEDVSLSFRSTFRLKWWQFLLIFLVVMCFATVICFISVCLPDARREGYLADAKDDTEKKHLIPKAKEETGHQTRVYPGRIRVQTQADTEMGGEHDQMQEKVKGNLRKLLFDTIQ